ncbi:IS1/IS1595 family N-terminal zinc-binding domain-containing protein, partial [Bifidobacterium longum subsp. longum]
MRTPSSKAKRCPVRGRAMKKNGRTGKGVQRWKCPACRLSSTMPQRRRRRERTLEE